MAQRHSSRGPLFAEQLELRVLLAADLIPMVAATDIATFSPSVQPTDGGGGLELRLGPMGNADPDSAMSILGVEVEPQSPTSNPDINGDGSINAADAIDLLQEIYACLNDVGGDACHQPAFDFSGDGTLDANDLYDWLSSVGFELGDANMDGTVDRQDLELFDAGGAELFGDYNADGVIDGFDRAILRNAIRRSLVTSFDNGGGVQGGNHDVAGSSTEARRVTSLPQDLDQDQASDHLAWRDYHFANLGG